MSECLLWHGYTIGILQCSAKKSKTKQKNCDKPFSTPRQKKFIEHYQEKIHWSMQRERGKDLQPCWSFPPSHLQTKREKERSYSLAEKDFGVRPTTNSSHSLLYRGLWTEAYAFRARSSRKTGSERMTECDKKKKVWSVASLRICRHFSKLSTSVCFLPPKKCLSIVAPHLRLTLLFRSLGTSSHLLLNPLGKEGKP